MDAQIGAIAETLDRLVEIASGATPRFADMARAAGLDPASDFREASLRDVDFRDEDLTGFSFQGADLTGCDFRRARGLTDDALDGAVVRGAIGLPEAIEARRTEGSRIVPSDGSRVAAFVPLGPSRREEDSP